MANIINHYLLFIGSSTEINRLKSDLSHPVSAFKLLKSEGSKVYIRLDFRPADHPAFGKPDGLLWDFANGYDEVAQVSELLAEVSPALDTMTEFVLTNRPAEAAAIFVFQAKYSPAIEGVFRLSTNYPTLNVRSLCTGTFGNQKIEAIEMGLLAGQEQYFEIYNNNNFTEQKQAA